MKKIMSILLATMVLIGGTFSFAHSEQIENERPSIEISGEVSNNTSTEKELTDASEKILENMSKKERKIAEYTDKYNDKNLATTAYVLDRIQLYSIPVCIIGLTWGAFNYFIIGEKKLDKKEQGFGYIVAFLVGLVIFQVIPLVFALLVAGK